MKFASRNAVLPDIPLLRFLPPDERAVLAARFEPQSVTAGTTIVRQGAVADGLYVVTEGRVRISKAGDYGDEVPIATLGPGDTFGDVGSHVDAAPTGTVRASSEVELLCLYRAVFDALLESRPELRQHFERHAQQRLLYDRFRQFTARVLQTGPCE